MWPAVILAARRNERVKGRTLILIVSIITKNGFNQWGAPPGRSAAAHEVVLKIIADIIKLNHKGAPNLSVNRRCLENLNTAGRSPIKLILIIIIKRLTIIELNPFKCIPWVRFLWLFIKLIKKCVRIIKFVGEDHIDKINKKMDEKVNIQNIIGPT